MVVFLVALTTNKKQIQFCVAGHALKSLKAVNNPRDGPPLPSHLEKTCGDIKFARATLCVCSDVLLE
jgi:hypothetical protein